MQKESIFIFFALSKTSTSWHWWAEPQDGGPSHWGSSSEPWQSHRRGRSSQFSQVWPNTRPGLDARRRQSFITGNTDLQLATGVPERDTTLKMRLCATAATVRIQITQKVESQVCKIIKCFYFNCIITLMFASNSIEVLLFCTQLYPVTVIWIHIIS